MDLTYSKSDTMKKLQSLPKISQIAFGIACCERLLPNYFIFSERCKWGTPSVLRNALNELWEHVRGLNLSDNKVLFLSKECESCAPDSDDFDSVFTAPAQEAALSICAVFDYILTSDSERIAQVSAFSVDAVDAWVQNLESMNASDPEMELKIRSHPLMKKELEWQSSAMNYFKGDWCAEDARLKWSPAQSNLGIVMAI